ncbi:MAG: hypothetical protein GY940_15985 [bacterium]|nr:hypothetical protein [bacterium]
MTSIKELSSWKRGQEFLGVDYPILSGAMTWISDSKLVQAVSDAGGLGALAAGNMPVELLEKEILALKASGANYAANLITIAPNYPEHLELVADIQAPIVFFAGSFPRKNEMQKVKDSGAKVICFASTESIADRMIDYGADALVLEGSEAGGHIGHVSSLVLIQQILFKFRHIPIIMAGGIATGEIMAHLFLMGATGIQMGTVFAMAEESPAHPKFKERFKKARSREAASTPQYDSALPVVAVRALKNKGTDEFSQVQLSLVEKLKRDEISRMDAQNEVEVYWVGALRRAVQDGDVDFGSLMAGQSVGLVSEVKSVKNIILDMVADADKEFQRVKGMIG